MKQDDKKRKRKTVKDLREDLDKTRQRIHSQIDKIQNNCQHQFERQYSCAESWSICKICEFSK